uniref:Ninja-family protein n=1 Tax=Ananas comosus var. bracteatus TaxID=296719 RepID=A0A6V7PHP3_ANACO|nr:unnamed protein product [Ananas comosus var. bracteatus]
MAPNPTETELPNQSLEQHVEALDLTLGLSLPQRPPTDDNVLGMHCSNPDPNPDPNPNLTSSDPLVAPWPLLVPNNDPYSATRCLRNPNAYVMMPCWVAPDRGAMFAAQMQHVNGNENAGTGDLARAPTAVGPFHGGSTSRGSSCVREERKRCEIPAGAFSGDTVEHILSNIPSSSALRPRRIAEPVPSITNGSVSGVELNNGATMRRLVDLSRTQQILLVTCSSNSEGPFNGEAMITVGLLYKYTSRDEVRISCACHGSSFSPEEFARHAGCTDTSQALREIVVHVPL